MTVLYKTIYLIFILTAILRGRSGDFQKWLSNVKYNYLLYTQIDTYYKQNKLIPNIIVIFSKKSKRESFSR